MPINKPLIKSCFWQEHLTLSRYLAFFPLLALSNNFKYALILSALLVPLMLISNLFSYLFCHLRTQARLFLHIFVLALLVGFCQVLLQAFIPNWATALGIYLPLIASFDVLVLQKTKPVVENFYHALGLVLLLIVLAVTRELLSAGFSIFQLAPGGFIVLALFLALYNRLKKTELLIDSETRRQRVTGKIA